MWSSRTHVSHRRILLSTTFRGRNSSFSPRHGAADVGGKRRALTTSQCFFAVGDEVGQHTAAWNLGNTRDYVNQAGLSRAAIFNQVDASLERLETSYIDLLQIHRFDFATPVEETMKALHDLVQSGKVRYIGASSMRTWQFALMNDVAEKHNWTKFVSMQNEYSLLYREEEREMIPYCLHNGIGNLAVRLAHRPAHQHHNRPDSLVSSGWRTPRTRFGRGHRARCCFAGYPTRAQAQ